MKYDRFRGSSSNMVRVFIPDNTSTKGAGLSALTSGSTNLGIAFIRELDSTWTTFTGANIQTITTIGTFQQPADSNHVRFKAVDSTVSPGLYEVHFHDSCAIFGTGDTSRNVQIIIYEVTTTALNIGPNMSEIRLIAWDMQTALGSTAVGSVTGAVGSVTGNVGGNVSGNVSGSVGSVTGAVGSVTGAVGSVTGNVGGSTASVAGAVGSVSGNVGGDVGGKVLGGGAGTISGDGVRASSVTGAVGSVTGAVGSVTGLTASTIAAAVLAASIESGVSLAHILEAIGAATAGDYDPATGTFKAVGNSSTTRLTTVLSGGARTNTPSL